MREVTAETILGVLSGHTYTYRDEAHLHDGIAAVLQAAGVPVIHEARVNSHDRPDFLCGTVCIEVKIAGETMRVFRQLQRYAHLPQVTHLILVTTVADHTSLPNTVAGTPLDTLLVGGAW